MKVVVAEIDPSLRADFQRKFDTWGHEAVVVEDGLEAWKAIQQHKPDMVILNWELPTLDAWTSVRRSVSPKNSPMSTSSC